MNEKLKEKKETFPSKIIYEEICICFHSHRLIIYYSNRIEYKKKMLFRPENESTPEKIRR